MEVDAGLYDLILLLREEPGPTWGGGWMDDACCQEFTNVFLHILGNSAGHGGQTPLGCRVNRREVNRAVINVVRWQRGGSGFDKHLLDVRGNI